jgi:hypothetical protein
VTHFRRYSTPRYQTFFFGYVMHVLILDIKLQIAEKIEEIETTLKIMHKMVIQEGLVKHR